MSRRPRLLLQGGFAVALGGLILLAGACSGERTQDTASGPAPAVPGASTEFPDGSIDRQENALVRFIAAVPGGPVDVFTDGRVVFPKLTYKTVTQYRPMDDQRLTFRVRPSGEPQGQPLAENSEGLAGGNHYTLVAYDNAEGMIELVAFDDDLTLPPHGKAKVRVINAAPEIGQVDVYAVGRDTLFTGVNSGSVSKYTTIDPMEVALQIRPEGQRNALLSIDNMRFEAGGIYTIVVVGRAESTPPLAAIRIEDRFQGISGAQLR